MTHKVKFPIIPNMMTTESGIARKLRGAREAAGRPREWVALEMHCSAQTIERWESGRGGAPKPHQLRRLAELFGIEASEFLQEVTQ